MQYFLSIGAPITVGRILFSFSSLWPYCFGGLAVALLLSGLDDLVPLGICLWHHAFALKLYRHARQLEPPERRIAIFVPCWKESEVIGKMVRHNLASIRYRNFDFFLGVYPNDQATVSVAHQLAETFANVHAAVCSAPGPTSKADCLNCLYHGMEQFEVQENVAFDTVVLHDAEDVIHPEALPLINRERWKYAMVQVPVLPIPTPFVEATHGVYCDEFAEFQTIDMHARQYSDSFVPSNGVGTGFAREILHRLASERGEIFDAGSLTEDYEVGIYIHDAGYRQLFAPLTGRSQNYIATREYFPRTMESAIRQRTRWITGIALQCWERRGWRGGWRTRYWFWRDRKGLIANPVSVLTNVLFLAGLIDWGECALAHRPWDFAISNPTVVVLCGWTTALQCLRIGIRMVSVGRIFGPLFALGVPLRSFHGNLINCSATLRALWRYTDARSNGQKLVWQKTAHTYAAGASLGSGREFSEVLVSCGFISPEVLDAAIRAMPAQAQLGEYLLETGKLSDEDLCRAVSLHTGVATARVDAAKVKPRVARSLPAHVEKRWGLVPIDLQGGRLVVAGRSIPAPEAFEKLKEFTSLPVDFQLVTQRNYDELRQLL